MEDITASYDIDTDEGWNDDQMSFVDQSKLDTLISFGFQEEFASSALVVSRGNVEAGVEWIFNNPSSMFDPWDMVTMPITMNRAPDKPLHVATPISVNRAPKKSLIEATPINVNRAPDIPLPDGRGKYKLMGLVSHIGKSAQCGQYVAHVYKDGRWVIFNDEKEEMAKAKDLHPKLLCGMFFFFALEATGGITSLFTSDKPIFESLHAVTSFRFQVSLAFLARPYRLFCLRYLREILD